MYLERRLRRPRHIEIQLLGDAHGTVLPFVERECSIQRRHQKVVEESPSLALEPATRQRMADCAARVAASVGYTNAGTIEFLLDEHGEFYFLEMNTRLQVEHPVTEIVTGVDLVHWQLRIARGERLTIPPGQALTPRAHAIECRIYAEDPDRGFLPSPGLVRAIRAPSGPGVRDDRGVDGGFEIPVFYDSMISKLIVWGPNRADAIRRLRRALDDTASSVCGRPCRSSSGCAASARSWRGAFDTTYLDTVLAERRGLAFGRPSDTDETDAAVAAALGAWLHGHAASAAQAGSAGGSWRRAARLEGLS